MLWQEFQAVCRDIIEISTNTSLLFQKLEDVHYIFTRASFECLLIFLWVGPKNLAKEAFQVILMPEFGTLANIGKTKTAVYSAFSKHLYIFFQESTHDKNMCGKLRFYPVSILLP